MSSNFSGRSMHLITLFYYIPTSFVKSFSANLASFPVSSFHWNKCQNANTEKINLNNVNKNQLLGLIIYFAMGCFRYVTVICFMFLPSLLNASNCYRAFGTAKCRCKDKPMINAKVKLMDSDSGTKSNNILTFQAPQSNVMIMYVYNCEICF